MRTRQGQRGFTLLEIIMALFIMGVMSAGTTILFPPVLTLFDDLTDQERVRQEVVASLEVLGREASLMRAIYVDTTKCYAACMEYVDPGTNPFDETDDTNHRIIYYWSGNFLMRKKELTSAGAVNCASGGVHFVGNLNPAATSFTVNRELLSVNMAAIGVSNNYQLSAVYMPIVKEREILFTEGFECNTFKQGTEWTRASSGNHTNWQIVAGTQGFGSYEMAHVVVTGALDTATVETAIDMTRYPKALLSFSYRNQDPTILPAGHGLYVDWYDGSSWQNVYAHDTAAGAPPTTATTVKVDLTKFGLMSGSKLRFRGITNSATSRWHVDNIKIASP